MKNILNICIGALVIFGSGIAAAQTPETILRHLAASQLGLDTSCVSLVMLNEPDLAGPTSDYIFKFASIPRGQTVVRAISPKHRDRAFSVLIDIWEEVLVARVSIARGATLDPGDFTLVRREVTHSTPVATLVAATKRARRRIPAGRILVFDAMEDIPDVHRGARVTLIAIVGSVKVTRTGVALADAQIGEPIRVRLDRRTIILATVTGIRECAVGP